MRRRIVLAILVVSVASATPAAVLAARLWDVGADPSTLIAGDATAVRVTVTNTGDGGGGSEIACVRIQVPSGFTISSVAVVSVHGQTSGAAAQAWKAVWAGGSAVTFKEPADDWPLIGSSPPEDEAVFRITGTASTPGSMTWTANAADKPGNATSLTCGSGDDFATTSLGFAVVAQPTPSPKPTPAPTPAPTPTPTPAPTPAPTRSPPTTPKPSPTPTHGSSPSARPTPSTPASPVPTPVSGATSTPSAGDPTASVPPVDGASPSPEPSPDQSGSSAPSPAGSSPSGTPSGSSAPGRGLPPDPGGTGGGLHVGDAGSEGDGAAAMGGLGAAALSALDKLPGGLLSWSYPALVMSVPGLLLLLAIGAQAFGALAWLPVIRRKLGGFQLGRRPDQP